MQWSDGWGSGEDDDGVRGPVRLRGIQRLRALLTWGFDGFG